MGNEPVKSEQGGSLPSEAENRLLEKIDRLQFELEEERKHCVRIHQELEREKELSSRLSERVTLDPLTGLYNRHSFEEQVKGFLHNGVVPTWSAFGLIDCREFKWINDNLGHKVGDEVLRQIAGLLKKCLRPFDFPARWGGDEFSFFLISLKHFRYANKIAQRFKNSVHDYDWTAVHPGFEQKWPEVDIGVVFVKPGNGITYEELFEQADAMMYLAKYARLAHPLTLDLVKDKEEQK